MKYSVKTCLPVILISLLTAVSLAGPGITVGQTSGAAATTQELARDLTVWCQEPINGNFIESQISANPEEIVIIIADFVSPGDEAVTGMSWWGLLAGGVGPVDQFVISFYQFGDCSGPDGEFIYQRTVDQWSESASDWGLTEYSADIDPVPMDAGQTYWVSIQAVMDIGTGGYWGWGSGATELCPSLGMSPSFGIFDWIRVYPDFFPDLPELEERAFCLYTDGSVSTENTSLSSVKSLFR